MTEENKIVLGLDPGLRKTGWAVIEVYKMKEKHIANGVVSTNPKLHMVHRLENIYTKIYHILDTYSPMYASVEKVFVNKNAQSSLLLGQARGVILLALARENIGIGEYSPNEVKKNIVGYGHATKIQMIKMLQQIFPNIKITNEDSADALALAICHSMHIKFKEKTS